MAELKRFWNDKGQESSNFIKTFKYEIFNTLKKQITFVLKKKFVIFEYINFIF